MKIAKISKKIGVAVSGGIDSMVLLRLLEEAKENILVINFEHGIRGLDSVSDSRFVRDYCESRGIPFLGIVFDSVSESKKRGVSVELAARQLRYEHFERLLREKTVEVIALGHHADDNTETVLMRILRGTGVKGLTGITEREGYIRPLLKFSRQEIEAYAKKHNVPYREDLTNKDESYTRNFLRGKVIPLLKERYPALNESFARLSESAGEITDMINSLIVPFEKKGDTVYMSIDCLKTSHIAVRKESIAKALAELGAVQDVEYTHREALNALIFNENGAKINLPMGITAIKEYDRLAIYRESEREFIDLPFADAFPLTFDGGKYTLENADGIIEGKTFDLDKIPSGARVRCRQEGDRFRRCGGRTKKLSDFLTDIKYPLKERDKLLLIADGNEIFVIIDIEISDKVKIDENTENIRYVKRSDK